MKRFSFNDIFSIGLGLASFAIVAVPKLSAITILLLVVIVIAGYIRKELVWKMSAINMLFVALYLAYVIGSFFTHDWSIAGRYLEYKMALLLLPLLLSVKSKSGLSLQLPVTGLILATIALSVKGWINAMDCFDFHAQSSGWIRYCFTSTFISPVHHPTYFAGFLLIGFIGAVKGYKEKWKGFGLVPVLAYCTLAVVMYMLCLALSGILFLFLLGGLWIIYMIYKRFGKIAAGAVILAFPLIIWLISAAVPFLKEELGAVKSELAAYTDNPSDYLDQFKGKHLQGNQERLILWTITGGLMAEHPFGVGTGNVDEYLDRELDKQGFHTMVELDLNPHNQYLQTGFEIGFAGTAILIALFVAGIVYSVRRKSWLMFAIVAGLAFNALFESMFQRQSGIVFYSFWIPLMIAYFESKEKSSLFSGTKKTLNG